MTHFTDAELLQWRESGPGHDRARLLDLVGGGSIDDLTGRNVPLV
jgi:hypothetical protein